MGLFSFSVEQTICCLNMLVQHFGVLLKLGKKFRVFLECMQLEVGVNVNPLTLPFWIYGPLATYCWFKILWERLCYYGFSVYLFYPTIHFPRERDTLMVDLFLAAGYSGEELRSLNRRRLYLQMLFLLDIVVANGRQVDKSYLVAPRYPTDCSWYTFPREEPTPEDWME